MHDSSEDHSDDICRLVGSGLFVRPLILGILGGCKANDGGVFAVIYYVVELQSQILPNAVGLQVRAMRTASKHVSRPVIEGQWIRYITRTPP